MEQTLVTPGGILACQRWSVLVIDISNDICTDWGSEGDDVYFLCTRGSNSTLWALGLLLVQVSRAVIA